MAKLSVFRSAHLRAPAQPRSSREVRGAWGSHSPFQLRTIIHRTQMSCSRLYGVFIKITSNQESGWGEDVCEHYTWRHKMMITQPSSYGDSEFPHRGNRYFQTLIISLVILFLPIVWYFRHLWNFSFPSSLFSKPILTLFWSFQLWDLPI